MKILILEDDHTLNETISHFLRMKGNEVSSCQDGSEAILKVDECNFDLYVIDINTPNINGISVVEYIRQKDLDTPVIMITASIEIDTIKKAYISGCDDYLKKPFYLEELNLRINKLIGIRQTEGEIIKISETITYDTEYEELIVNGCTKRLRKKEKRLLNLLLKNINKTVPIEKIETYVWENAIKDTYPVRQLVNELRKHFDNGEKYIYSNRGLGYKFEIKN